LTELSNAVEVAPLIMSSSRKPGIMYAIKKVVYSKTVKGKTQEENTKICIKISGVSRLIFFMK